jgi:hypothetical protein
VSLVADFSELMRTGFVFGFGDFLVVKKVGFFL